MTPEEYEKRHLPRRYTIKGPSMSDPAGGGFVVEERERNFAVHPHEGDGEARPAVTETVGLPGGTPDGQENVTFTVGIGDEAVRKAREWGATHAFVRPAPSESGGRDAVEGDDATLSLLDDDEDAADGEAIVVHQIEDGDEYRVLVRPDGRVHEVESVGASAETEGLSVETGSRTTDDGRTR